MEYNKYVKTAQTDLKEAGYNIGTAGADGKFGKDTLNAVRDAIAEAVLARDGSGLGTDLGTDVEYVFCRELEFGDEGEDVVNLQRMLKKWHMGYYLGDAGADGIFGRRTQKAVIEFQKGMSLEIDGVVTQKIWDLLLTDSVDISYWITPQYDNGLPFACNCKGKYCRSEQNAVAGEVSVGLMILLVRIENEINKKYKRDDILVRLTDDIDTRDDEDRNGGNRCERWNRVKGGSKNSQHTKNCAADVFLISRDGRDCPSVHELFAVADELNPYGGVGEYRNNIHVDTRGWRGRW